LKKDGYRSILSLETNWRGVGTPEESIRQSMGHERAITVFGSNVSFGFSIKWGKDYFHLGIVDAG
jgi:hypothetical protein